MMMIKSRPIALIIIILIFFVGFGIYEDLKNRSALKYITIENNELQNKINDFETKKAKTKQNIKNYILTYYKTIPFIIAEEIAQNILIASKKHGLSFITIVAVMEVESSFNPMQVGPRTKYGKARGLMQVMPKFWIKELKLKNKYDFHNIKTGIDSGTYILKKYLTQKNYNMKKALYKYVNGDNQYVKDVYECMGKFIIHRSIANMSIQEPINSENKKDITKEKDFIHIVKHRGETLSLIAKWRTGNVNNWRRILKANPDIIPKKIQIGTKIVIPNKLLKRTYPIVREFIDEYYENRGKAEFFSNTTEKIL